MQTIKFLQANGKNFSKLTEAFGIKVKDYPEHKLVVLNYDQIESPKTNPIVMECRGLILDYDLNVVCRPFDRFFNLGEAPDTQAHLDMMKATAYAKIDGSFIKIYNHEGVWYCGTRGTAFAESNVGDFDLTFKDLVFKALHVSDDTQFQLTCNRFLHPLVTYCFEVTAMENRVVTRYEGYTLHFLGARFTATGEYVSDDVKSNVLGFGAKEIKEYKFDTPEAAKIAVNELGNLEEGFVVWQDGKPVCKIKSDAYVAVHHIRGEGLTQKRICDLVLSGEQEEYLTYFPEDRVHIQPTADRYDQLIADIHKVQRETAHITDQKQFAIAIKDLHYKSVLFTTRNHRVSVKEAIDRLTDNAKRALLTF
jgi:T4 RnlA family RNA ligase